MNGLLIVMLILGAINILTSFTVDTKNLLSSMLFKFVPFISGACMVVLSLELLEIISIFN